MTCLRHESCRRAVTRQIRDWPTATHPRFFIVTILGSLAWMVGFAYVFIIAPFLLWYMATQTGSW